MVILFYLGLGLLCLAFLSGAAEAAARLAPGMNDIMISAYDLWHTLSPTSLVHAHIVIQRNIGQWLWDPVLKTVMKLPAWVLFGVPGAALTWIYNPRSHSQEKEPINEADFFLLDALAKKAREDGYGAGGNGDKPDHGHGFDMKLTVDDGQDTPSTSKKAEREDSFFLFDELSKGIVNGEYVDPHSDPQKPPLNRNNG